METSQAWGGGGWGGWGGGWEGGGGRSLELPAGNKIEIVCGIDWLLGFWLVKHVRKPVDCRRANMEPHDVLWDCFLLEFVLGYVSVQRVRLELALPGFYVPELLAAEVTEVNLQGKYYGRGATSPQGTRQFLAGPRSL